MAGETLRGLPGLLELFHPAYRRHTLPIAAASALGGLLTYGENASLAAMTRALVAQDRAPVEALAWCSGAGIRAATFFLVAFACVRLAGAGLTLFQERQQGALELGVLSDLEAQVLGNLLRKDEAFFASHSHGELLNRFGGDIKRVSQWRGLALLQARAACLLVGNLYFFAAQSWRLAAVALLVVGLGAGFASWLTRATRVMDRSYLSADDRVKGAFEDLLGMGAEVQASNLLSYTVGRFTAQQRSRSSLFVRYVGLESLVTTTPLVGYALAVVALTLSLIRRASAAGPAGAAASATVPVVLKALPELFSNASSLVAQRLVIQRAHASARRLLEYEAASSREEGEAPTTPAPGPVAVKFEGSTYRYASPDGTLQGGVVALDAELRPGEWTAIVGAAGSGKSTMLQLLLGRLRPQEGTVRIGARPLETLGAAERGAVFALMPQRYVAVDSTIEDNLTFGRAASAEPSLSDDDLALIEELGLADVCKAKGLDMVPEAGQFEGRLASALVGLRPRVRELLASEGIAVTPYEGGGADPQHLAVESLLVGKCDRRRLLQLLDRPAGRRSLAGAVSPTFAGALAEEARRLLEAQTQLLALTSYDEYTVLAGRTVDEPIWRLRRAALDGQTSAEARQTLILVGLTLSLAELGLDHVAVDALAADWRVRFAPDATALRTALGDLLSPFELALPNAQLTWRENLVFGFVQITNQRAAQRTDQLLVKLVASERIGDDLVRVGVRYHVGRGGTRLSGGQRQLVALARTLLRRAPIVVLDEPTSALDPASRARVAATLTRWREGRVLVTVSHDPELVRHADRLLVLEHGRIAAAGTFEELQRESEIFRRTLRV